MKVYNLTINDIQYYGFSTKSVRTFKNEKDALSALADLFREEAREYDFTEEEIQRAIDGDQSVIGKKGEIFCGGSYAYISNMWYIDVFETEIELGYKSKPIFSYIEYAPILLCDDKVFKKEITKSNAKDVINAFYEYKGAEEYEALYDLTDTEEFEYFGKLYGLDIARACADMYRFWIGGLGYYANPKDKSGCRCCEIVGIKNITEFAKSIVTNDMVGRLEEIFDSHDYTGSEKKAIADHATDCFYGVFDFSEHFGVSHREGIDISIDDYDMDLGELDLDEVYEQRLLSHYGHNYKKVVITFKDGIATTPDEFVTITYSTIDELDNDTNTDWKQMDMYNDGTINFFQIQYWHHKRTIVGWEDDKFNPIEIVEKDALLYVALYVYPIIAKKVEFDGIWGETSALTQMANIFIEFAKGIDESFFEFETLGDLVDEFRAYTEEEFKIKDNAYRWFICENHYLDNE